MELSLLRRKADQNNTAREYFVCFGKALFKGPKQQFDVLKTGGLISLPYLAVNAQNLTLSIHRTAELIVKARLAERSRIEAPLMTEHSALAEVLSVSTALEKKIKSALELNLAINP